MQELTERHLDLIERIGVVHERQGLRPAAGRIVGLLLVTPDGELTFDEIRHTLELSKSATSTSLSFLQGMGSVEYRTRPGDRKRYFRKSVEEWERQFFERAMRFLDIRMLFSEVSDLHRETGTGSDAALDRMTGFLEMLAGAVQVTYEEWVESNSTIHHEITPQTAAQDIDLSAELMSAGDVQ